MTGPPPPTPAAGAPAAPGGATSRQKNPDQLRGLAFGLAAVTVALWLFLVFAFVFMVASGIGGGKVVDTSVICWAALVASTGYGIVAVVLGLVHVETTGREEWGGVVSGLLALVLPGICWILVAMHHGG